ncbi:tetratricopeptide repeat protein [Marinoscillum pacificum]|uniref:tetratricopeptide repeat protein n=1 Tax=Marinoscillum pacificum TaxID=392723 RepID=UPI0021589DF7|nr:tetratricopeptide repeat protein [Marinoscillum pacificum]
MNRQQIILSVGALLAVVLIYQLPRVVVENETTVEVETHDFSISNEDETTFTSLRQQLKESSDIKKSINFADSLAKLSLKYQLIDSAASYARLILSLDGSREAVAKASMIYYQAFQATTDAEQSKELASKARDGFEALLVEDPQNNFLKNKLAMTLMTTEAPMAGVQVLREVLASDPENREAILNLGLLAIRSRQFDRAEERFINLLELDSTDYEAQFYYGVSLSEGGKTEEAKAVFEKLVSTSDADPALKATASSLIKELENI